LRLPSKYRATCRKRVAVWSPGVFTLVHPRPDRGECIRRPDRGEGTRPESGRGPRCAGPLVMV